MQFIKTNDIEILLKLYPHMKDLCNKLIGGDNVRTALELTESFIRNKGIDTLEDSNWIVINTLMVDWVEQYISDESFSETMMLPSDQVVLDMDNLVHVVNDFEIEAARSFLKKAGFYTENLWTVHDVKGVHEHITSDEEAMDILNKSLTNDATMEQIQFSIREFGERNEDDTH